MGLFDKWIKGEKPDYGLLEDFVNKPDIPNWDFSSYNPNQFRTRMFDTSNPVSRTLYEGVGPTTHRGIYQTDTDEGKRYYFGEGESYFPDKGRALAMNDARLRSQMFPGDSIATEQYNQFQKYGLFE